MGIHKTNAAPTRVVGADVTTVPLPRPTRTQMDPTGDTNHCASGYEAPVEAVVAGLVPRSSSITRRTSERGNSRWPPNVR